MKNYFLLIFTFLLLSTLKAQNKKDWYILAETGFNNVNSNKKIHFGVGVEYFISNTKSFTVRLKYLKNGVDHKIEGARLCLFGGCNGSERLLYEASSIKIPINYKWEKSTFIPKLNIFLTGGLAFNFKLEENFIEIENLQPNKTTTTLELNAGAGFYYKLKPNFDIYILTESYSGSRKTKKEDNSRAKVSESLISFGIRYSLK